MAQSTIKAVRKAVTITAGTGYTVEHTLKSVNDILVGGLKVASNSDYPVGSWATVADISPVPANTIQISTFSPGTGVYTGLMCITTEGKIMILNTVSNMRSVWGTFSNPIK